MILRWFMREWWKYLLAKKDRTIPWRVVIWCRARGHPRGVIWQNMGGLEPNMNCKNCFDDLG